MSWECMRDNLEQAICACGQGYVKRHSYSEMDDWNRTRSGTYGESIQCDRCKKHYHLEHCRYSTGEPRWKDDGSRVVFYLVPNGLTLNHDVNEEYVPLGFDEKIASLYRKEQLEAVINEMKRCRFSTRLQTDESKNIVEMFARQFKRRSLPFIIGKLQDCLDNYDNYTWDFNSMQQHKAEQRKRIDDNKRIIEETIKNSHLLEFVTI